jgi:hypothetical protein
VQPDREQPPRREAPDNPACDLCPPHGGIVLRLPAIDADARSLGGNDLLDSPGLLGVT